MLSQNMCTLHVSVKKCLKRCENHMQNHPMKKLLWKRQNRVHNVLCCCRGTRGTD